MAHHLMVCESRNVMLVKKTRYSKGILRNWPCPGQSTLRLDKETCNSSFKFASFCCSGVRGPPQFQAKKCSERLGWNDQRTAKGASGKGPSKNVKKCRAKKWKVVKKCPELFSTLFDNVRAAPIFWPLLRAVKWPETSEPRRNTANVEAEVLQSGFGLNFLSWSCEF